MMDQKALTPAALCLALIVSLTACSKQQGPTAAPAPMVENVVEAKVMSDAAPAPAAPAVEAQRPVTAVTSATPAQQMGSSAATYTDSERKFIRTANARFRVKDVYVSALGIEDIVAAHGGFVVKNDITAVKQSAQSHPIGNGKLMELSEYAVQGNLIVRVPSARTQEFLRAIVGHVEFLDERSFSAHDAQFDLLRRQLEMMRGQDTQTDLGDAVKDGGKLSHKVDAINARNAAKEARDEALLAKKEFEDKVAFSTIGLQLYQPTKVAQSERVDIDSVYRQARPGFFSRMGEELRSGWEGLQSFTLALIGIWPAILILGAIAAAVVSLARRRRRRKAA
jgi:hypothetical protein